MRDRHWSASAGSSAGEVDTSIPAWDLSALYTGPDDQRIETDLHDAAQRADRFAARWRGNIAPGSMTATDLAGALAEWEAIETLGRKPAFYASLCFAADTQDATAQALYERTRERWMTVQSRLIFFSVELTRMPDGAYEQLCSAPELADARHYLRHLRRQRSHTLSEPEEQAITRKNLGGRDAFERLFEQLTGSFRFSLTVDGQDRAFTGEEMLALLSSPDRELRERAYTTYLGRFQEHGLVLTEIFNSLLLDHRLECELRSYADLAEPTHSENEVTASMVEGLMNATERHYELARRYFKLKARLLGVDHLTVTDIYAPVGNAESRVRYPDACRMILETFAGFSPRFHQLAVEFFERRWVDAVPRPGKAGGAACMSYAPTTNPFIVTSYTGTIRDVTTLAHELGHGIHDMLASRQRYVNYSPPLPLAETASVFAEMLLTRHLLCRERDTSRRCAILCMTIEEIIATVFRQNVLTRFELEAHEARRTAPVTAEQLGGLWWSANARLYGDAVEMIPAYRWGWSYIPHFIHSRFYCYAYVFGELVALTLYQHYLEEGATFAPKYLGVLEAGGSEAPADVLRRADHDGAGGSRYDMTDPAFWHQGFRAIAGLIDELESLGEIAG
jgi:oligoendopeptidase F